MQNSTGSLKRAACAVLFNSISKVQKKGQAGWQLAPFLMISEDG
jgi:hypothetical protein